MKTDVVTGMPIREATGLLLIKIVFSIILSEMTYLLLAFVVFLIPLTLSSLEPAFLIGGSILQMCIGIYVIIFLFLLWMNNYIVLNGKWLIRREGIFSTKEQVYDLSHIEAAAIHTSFLGKVFHFGTLSLGANTVSGYDHEIRLTNVYLPERIELYIQQYMSKDTLPLTTSSGATIATIS